MTNSFREHNKKIILKKGCLDTSVYLENKLINDVGSLRAIASIKAREEKKAKLIGKYLDHCKNIIKAGPSKDDPIIPTIFVWLVDIKNWNEAFIYCKFLYSNKIPLPAGIKSNSITFLIDGFYKYILRNGVDNFNDFKKLIDELFNYIHEIKDDLYDQVNAKIWKLKGLSTKNEKEKLEYLEQAVLYNPKISGIKKIIKDLKKYLSNNSENETTENIKNVLNIETVESVSNV